VPDAATRTDPHVDAVGADPVPVELHFDGISVRLEDDHAVRRLLCGQQPDEGRCLVLVECYGIWHRYTIPETE